MTASAELRAHAAAIRAVAEAQAVALERVAMQLDSGGDELLTLDRAAGLFAGTPRILRDAAKRGELVVAGPRSARVVRRSDLDAWLARRAMQPRSPVDGASDDVEDRDALNRAGQRLRLAFGRRP